MKHSDMKKERHANYGVACSGSRLCIDCRYRRREYKRKNNKAIRRHNRALTQELRLAE